MGGGGEEKAGGREKDPLAPYDDAIFTGEMYKSGDGTKVLERRDGTKVLQRADGVQVVKVQCSGFYCVDVESFQKPGTESDLSTLVTTVKVIVGGVAPLLMPWCIKNQGLLGGTLTIVLVGILSSFTVKQLVEYRDAVSVETGRDDLTYVDVAKHAFGVLGGTAVFGMTLVNSLGICAAYSAFIGTTLSSLSSSEGNIIHSLVPELSSNGFQLAAAALILPMNALASKCVDLTYGFSVTPDIFERLFTLPLFTSPVEYFRSFGVIPLLFCVHFAVLPIERSMKNRQAFPEVLDRATFACILANSLFGVLGFLFFGEETSSVVLDNLGNGSFLTWVKLSLVLDMLVSYPVMLTSSREIVENAILGSETRNSLVQRLLIRTMLISTAFLIAQINDVGKICNLVGGVCQCALAFMIPPALAMRASKNWGRPGSAAGVEQTIPQRTAGRVSPYSPRSMLAYFIIFFGGFSSLATLFSCFSH
ncbi:hypothetical protein GUITHDRAFT_107350 [Guillardia theta CCMP2712]|uniref:Amino acid transporter transmembrane domain-containing protein n=1 Tax=Guillardia theta (strain CCMP2712) TaxID=905079 RepID=L1JFY2_GUITC|nr:hypothetical protein GUITHDRAFT_107350 [Guillardia theta CCMP2712]EKX47005.1 hypothetical protein GUITHDRAFT_107350 [Guillardia theta CCMP2712]|eukprot:XP_005833985.1 hypothetical protein GUITHDRAFT_107350 [Guillardia theta CCMP2712]